MTSKKQKRKLARIITEQTRLLDMALSQLLIKELQVDAKMRSQALKAARKRQPEYIQ